MNQATNVSNGNILRPHEATRVKNVIAKIVMGLGLGIAGMVSAQQATETTIRSDEKITALSWGGLTWRIPERFFFGVRQATNDSKELWIQFGWKKKDGIFSPVDVKGYDMMLDVHVRKVNNEDPRNALALIHRIHLPFTRVPTFVAAQFNGMTYLGSSSSIHYFSLNNENAYVSCRLIDADRLMPPKVAPDVLSKEFTCNTVFFLPNKTYAWASIWGIHADEAASAFVAAHREIRSFIR